jgi:hypothetical protein
MKKVIFATALFTLGLTTFSFAQSTPKVDARQDIQKARIKEGVQSGELTKAEADKMRANQAVIQHAEHKAKADGVVTKGERKKLDKMQDRSSKRVKHQKHDKQDRH